MTIFISLSHWGMFEIEVSLDFIQTIGFVKDGYLYTPLQEDLFGCYI